MMLRFSRISSKQNEQGAILIVFAICVLTLFILLGLAVDAGNLYNARIACQNAADAGALAGASLKILKRTTAEAQDGARDVAEINLDLKGVNGTVTPTYFSGPNEMHVLVEADVSLFLMGLLPTTGTNTSGVATEATAKINPARVSVILDTSESMACPATDLGTGGACDCTPNCSQTTGGSRIEALRDAALLFVDHFDPGADSINVVTLGTGAELIVPMQDSSFDETIVNNAISGISAKGETNTCDALIRAYMDVVDDGNRTGDASYVYFSDGAPTAARFIFSGADPTQDNNILGKPWSTYDYLSWGILGPTGVSIPNKLYGTPPYTDLGNNEYWNPRVLGSNNPRTPPAKLIVPSTPNEPQPWLAFSDVVTNGMEIMLPNGNTARLGFASRWGANYLWADWQVAEHMMLYSDCALAMADFIHEQGGVFYTIGYGMAAPIMADPYQNAQDPLARKDYFLTRVSLDPCGIVDRHPPFPGIPTLIQLAQTDTRSGVYFPTSDPERLESIFLRIARRIKLRLIK